MSTTATEHRYTFDTPSDNTIYVTASSEQQARDKLTEALNMGVLLDVDAGDGVFVHQASTLVGRPPVLYAIDDDPVDGEAGPWLDDLVQFGRLVAEADTVGAFTDEVATALAATMDLPSQRITELIARACTVWEQAKATTGLGIGAQQGRLVLDCGIGGCDRSPTQTVTYTLSGMRLLDFLCDPHAEDFAARHESDPVLAPLELTGTRTMPAGQVRPWTRVWEMHDVPEWPQRQRFRWLVLHTLTYRSLDDRLRVRWTYQDGRTRDFDHDELVTGVFSTERPEV